MWQATAQERMEQDFQVLCKILAFMNIKVSGRRRRGFDQNGHSGTIIMKTLQASWAPRLTAFKARSHNFACRFLPMFDEGLSQQQVLGREGQDEGGRWMVEHPPQEQTIASMTGIY